VAAAILASWRRCLHDLDCGNQVDILQLKAGSPQLQVASYLPLAASSASGIDVASLLRASHYRTAGSRWADSDPERGTSTSSRWSAAYSVAA